MNSDDIDFDKMFEQDMPFKPLTKGLGFHHEPKDEQKLGTLKARSKDLEKSLNERAALLNKSSVREGFEEKDMGDLAPFYGVKNEKPVRAPKAIEEKVKVAPSATKAKAGLVARFAAFALDLAVLLCALAVTFLSILLFSGISLLLVRESLSLEFAAVYVLPVGLLFYFFYFSFFDKTNFSTPGKKMMGLKVVSETSPRVSMAQSFARSAICLASVLSGGMASLLDFQGKLTETKVVNR